jgi:hypothetical protein
MNFVACAAPLGSIEPAPLTSLPIFADSDTAKLSAFWADDDSYYIRVDATVSGTQWYQIDGGNTEVIPSDEAARAAIGALMADIIPMGGGRVAFPVGSTGRTVFRVWRSKSAGRTKILAVRAARSRRLPA